MVGFISPLQRFSERSAARSISKQWRHLSPITAMSVVSLVPRGPATPAAQCREAAAPCVDGSSEKLTNKCELFHKLSPKARLNTPEPEIWILRHRRGRDSSRAAGQPLADLTVRLLIGRG